jgi:uncharacterized protein (TIGR02246 family)
MAPDVPWSGHRTTPRLIGRKIPAFGGPRRRAEMSGHDTIGVVDDVEAIRQLKARYFRTMDTKDWQAMRRVFTDDAVIDTTASGGREIAGADEFMSFLQETLAGVITAHHGHMPEITLTSASTASGIWALQDMLVWPDGSRMHGYGHYHDTYEKVDGAWLIRTSTLSRLHMDITARE